MVIGEAMATGIPCIATDVGDSAYVIGETGQVIPSGDQAALAGAGPLTERYLRCLDVWATRVEERPALLRIALWEMAGATAEREVPLTAHVRPIVECLSEAVREGQRQGVFRKDVDPVGFVMSVAGTTAFLGLRTALLNTPVAPPLERGQLATELRAWATRILFTE